MGDVREGGGRCVVESSPDGSTSSGGGGQRAIHSVETQVWALKLALDRN